MNLILFLYYYNQKIWWFSNNDNQPASFDSSQRTFNLHWTFLFYLVCLQTFFKTKLKYAMVLDLGGEHIIWIILIRRRGLYMILMKEWWMLDTISHCCFTDLYLLIVILLFCNYYCIIWLNFYYHFLSCLYFLIPNILLWLFYLLRSLLVEEIVPNHFRCFIHGGGKQ
jgi:hypothetical protein